MHMQQTYQNLAPLYDQLQQGIEPAFWADYIQQLEATFSRRKKQGDGQGGKPLLLDLGCGTGSICLEMSKLGYDPIGIDASEMMLDQARQKSAEMLAACPPDLSPPLFLLQDISQFELYGTVDLIVCLLDTINHLSRSAQVCRLFSLCANYLNPGGLLIFDVATEKHLSQTLGNQQFFQDDEDFTLLWQNSYKPKSGISRSELTLFSRAEDGSYTRYDETIVEKYYSSQQLRRWIAEAGLELAACYGELNLRRPKMTDERHFYIVRRPTGKPNRQEDVKE